MKTHKICDTCIHMDTIHCICGGEWIDNFCYADESIEDACSTPQEYLTLLSKKSGTNFSFWAGDLVSSRECYEDYEINKKYFHLLSENRQQHLISNSKEFNQSIIEVAIEIEEGIMVFFFIEDNETSLLKSLRKSMKILSSE